MTDGEWTLVYPGVAYSFGTPATPTFNRTTPIVGDVDLRVADVDRPLMDGRAFGVDYRSGRTISFDLGIRAATELATRDEAALLEDIWRADPVRLTPGAVAELHACYAGRERIAYGRPRRFAPDNADAAENRLITVQADFACADDLFYGPAEDFIQVGIVPGTGGGLLAPLASPLTSTMSSDRSQAITVTTGKPVWPVAVVHGPLTNGILTVAGALEWEIRASLLEGETVTIDTRPWARSALRNGTANIAGSVRGTRLPKAAIPAGRYEVGLKGTDPTGTAYVRLAWRPAYPSL